MYTLTVTLRYATIIRICKTPIDAYKLLTEYKTDRDVVFYQITKGEI